MPTLVKCKNGSKNRFKRWFTLDFVAFFPAFEGKMLLRQVAESDDKAGGKDPGNGRIKFHVLDHDLDDRIIEHKINGYN